VFFWGITPRSPLNVNRRFGGTCRLHLQGRRISQARNQCEAGGKQMEATCSSETSVGFNGLHGVISQKMELLCLNVNHLEHTATAFIAFCTKAAFVTSHHNFPHRCVVHSVSRQNVANTCSMNHKHSSLNIDLNNVHMVPKDRSFIMHMCLVYSGSQKRMEHNGFFLLSPVNM
jgi:hypothetical protein